MDFTAIIRRESMVYKMWRGDRRTQSNFGGVIFKLVPGMNYVSGVLNTDQIHALRQLPATVTLEMVTVAPASIAQFVPPTPVDVPSEPEPVKAPSVETRPAPAPTQQHRGNDNKHQHRHQRRVH